MAKKKEKGKKKKESGSPADTLRDAVERTFAGAASGTAGAQKRAQELFDEVTAAMAKVRDAVDERKLIDTLEHVRDQVEALARRVAALERGGGSSAAPDEKTVAAARAVPATGTTSKPKAATSRARSATAKPK